MFNYKIYSSDLWDYLGDMPYMPSRQDRDELVRAGEEKRVKIWDYFFRIDPDDVGAPQKKEIDFIDKNLSEEISRHNQQQQQIESDIRTNLKIIRQKRVKYFFYGIGGFVITGVLYYFFLKYDLLIKTGLVCILPLIILSFLMLLTVSFVGWKEKRTIKNLGMESRQLSDAHEESVKNGRNRKNALRDEIRELKIKMPQRASDDSVREWLRQDFKSLWNKSKEVTALSNRLINIDSNKVDKNGNLLKFPNPIAVVGPAELQRPKKIPLIFQKNPDLSRHFSARRSFYMLIEDRFEVLYGMYYLEHILIADNMLATYGLFYDFISGKLYAEEITEQYYKDVVAISTTHEFREITLSINDKNTKYIEDAPTFTLSLASGEHRTVTFVSEKYFMEIREKINVDEDDVSRIYWIVDAKENADMAVGALRFRLRLHKKTPSEKEL